MQAQAKKYLDYYDLYNLMIEMIANSYLFVEVLVICFFFIISITNFNFSI